MAHRRWFKTVSSEFYGDLLRSHNFRSLLSYGPQRVLVQKTYLSREDPSIFQNLYFFLWWRHRMAFQAPIRCQSTCLTSVGGAPQASSDAFLRHEKQTTPSSSHLPSAKNYDMSFFFCSTSKKLQLTQTKHLKNIDGFQELLLWKFVVIFGSKKVTWNYKKLRGATKSYRKLQKSYWSIKRLLINFEDDAFKFRKIKQWKFFTGAQNSSEIIWLFLFEYINAFVDSS